MKYFLMFSFIIVASIACNNSKNATNLKEGLYWKQLNSDDIPEKYKSFLVFKLNEKQFLNALENSSVVLPDENGNLNYFTIEESNTMSKELATKFPDLKTYKGTQSDNSLCKPRIETNKSKVKISVFCNDKTYFIDKDKNLNLFIVYTKKTAPNGIGNVSE